jgi:hypothetical protein
MPFIKSAYLSQQGTAREGNGDGGVNHFGAIRMRLTGTGSLLMTLYSLDDVLSQPLVAFTMALTSNIEPTRLCNFNQQRAALKIQTTVIDEYFRINRIILFTKPIYTSFPGTS